MAYSTRSRSRDRASNQTGGDGLSQADFEMSLRIDNGSPGGDATLWQSPCLRQIGSDSRQESYQGSGQEAIVARIDSLAAAIETTQSAIAQSQSRMAEMFKEFMTALHANGSAQNHSGATRTAQELSDSSPRVPGSDGETFRASTQRVLIDRDENAQTGHLTPSLMNQYGADVAHGCDFANSQPIPINQISPPRFDGDRAKARKWLKKYTNIMSINGYTDVGKYDRVSAYLDGEAWNCWVTEKRLRPNSDWYSFRNRFLTCFLGGETMGLLSKKVDATRQKSDESAYSYFTRVTELCLEYNPDMPDSELVNRIANGFLPEIYNALVLQRKKQDWTLSWLSENVLELRSVVRKDSREHTDQTKSTFKSKTPKPRDLSNWQCYNCNEKGHLTERCDKPKNEANIQENRKAYRLKKETDKRDGTQESSPREVNRLDSAVTSHATKTAELPCDTVSKPMLKVSINGKDVTARVDSGADMTVIPERLAKTLEVQILPWNQSSLRAVDSSPLDVIGMAPVLVTFKSSLRPLLIAILPDRQLVQPLWGNDLLHAFSIKFDFENASTSKDHPVKDDHCLASVRSDQHPLDKINIGAIESADKTLLEETFSRNETDIGRTSTVKHRIILTDDKPVYKPPYRIAYSLREDLDKELTRMKATGAIRDSKSPYASPAFFVDKDHGAGKRLVADFRALNAKTVLDRMPMPHPEDVFSLLAGMQTFAKLDITAMFNQIEIEEQDIDKTAITTPLGLFECPLMSFGLVNAPATAVRLMREVLRNLDNKICFVYFDGIIVYARNNTELVQRCILVLERLRLHNLKLKPAKCPFAMESVHFLGHIISSKGVSINPSRIEAVNRFPVPKTPSDVRSFYGLCSYNRKYIRDFADISKPLTPLMGKPSEFRWNSETQLAYDRLKQAITKSPVLVHYDQEAEHELRTDASSYAIGAVFYQKHSDPLKDGVVLYFSKTLNSAQRNYSATDRELLAAYTSIMELQHYLYGKRFTLVIDHSATSLRSDRDPHGRRARWLAKLQSFDFETIHRKGTLHRDADALSRLIEPESDSTERSLSCVIRLMTSDGEEIEGVLRKRGGGNSCRPIAHPPF